jgi:hypothetical protein
LRARAFREGYKASRETAAEFFIERLGFSRTRLAAWYRSDHGVRLMESRVIRWLDQSGNGRHADAGRRWVTRRLSSGLSLPERRRSAPLFVPEAVHGFPVLRGEVGQYLRLRRFVPLQGDLTFVFVASADAGGSGPVVGDGDDGDIRIDGAPPRSLSVRFNVGVPGTKAEFEPPLAPGGFAFWAIVRRDEKVLFYRSGDLIARKNLERVTPMNLELILARRTWTDFFRSELCELLVYQRALREDEIAKIIAYFERKYGPAARLPIRPTRHDVEDLEESEEIASTQEEEEEEPLPRAREETPERKTRLFFGTVKSVNAVTRLLRVAQAVDEGETPVTRRFRLSLKAELRTADGETFDLQTLQPGMKVRLRVSPDGRSALSITRL